MHHIVTLTDLCVTDEFGRTPLHNAILGKQFRIVELLLSRGANVEVQDERGDTPLHTAVRVGDERILQVVYKKVFYDSCGCAGINRIFSITCQGRLFKTRPRRARRLLIWDIFHHILFACLHFWS